MRSLSCSSIRSRLISVAQTFSVSRLTFDPCQASSASAGPGHEARRPICEPGFTGLPVRRFVEQLLEQLRVEVLVGVLADLHDRRVGAAAEALDLLPGELRRRARARAGARRCAPCRSRSAPRSRAACTASCRIPGDGRSYPPGQAGTWCRRWRSRARGCRPCRAYRRRRGWRARWSSPPAPGRATAAPDGRGFFAGRILGDLALRPGEVLRREGEAQRLLGI